MECMEEFRFDEMTRIRETFTTTMNDDWGLFLSLNYSKNLHLNLENGIHMKGLANLLFSDKITRL